MKPRGARVRGAYEVQTFAKIRTPHPSPLPEGEGARSRCCRSSRSRPSCGCGGSAGVGRVAGRYAIGLRGWGPRVAIPAALLLAVSGQHLVYSREPLVEADGLLFATLAALVYLQARSARSLLAAGVLWGLAFTCNHRLSYLPAWLLIAQLAW